MGLKDWIIIGVILAVIALIVYLYFSSLKKAGKAVLNAYLGIRYDDNDTLYYFKHTDFEYLSQETFTFKSNGLDLMGYKYYNDSVSRNGKLIVFFHGLGVGHVQYTSEIDYYTKQGYLVYTFDAQGSYNSQGEGLYYFTNYVKNGDDFISHIQVLRDYKSNKVIFMGHSLGAHSAVVLASLHKDKVHKVVAFAPFENIEILLRDQISGSLNKLAYKLARQMAILEKNNAEKYYLSALSAMNNDIETMVLFGDKDHILSYENNFLYFVNNLKDNKHKYFVTCKDRTHRPNLSLEASKYDTYRIVEFEKIKKTATPEEMNAYYRGLDYNLLVEMDNKVMNLIDDFLNEKEIKEKEIVLE